MTAPTNENDIDSLINLAIQEANSGNHTRAEELLLASCETLKALKQHDAELQVRVYSLLANSYKSSGNLTRAGDFYEKAKQALAARGPCSTSCLAFYDDMYVLCLQQGDLDLALTCLNDSREVLQRLPGRQAREELRNLLRLAALYWTNADYAMTDRYLREYLQATVAADDSLRHEHVSVLGYLGLIAFRMARLEEAESLYKEALAFVNKVEQAGHNEQAELLNQLGLVLCSQEKNREAQEGCRKAEQLRDEPVEGTGDQLRSIAGVYCAKNCFDEASKYCRMALDVIEMGALSDRTATFALALRRFALAEDAATLASSPVLTR